MERDTELLLRVARMYYIQSETIEAIAHFVPCYLPEPSFHRLYRIDYTKILYEARGPQGTALYKMLIV